MVYNCHDINTMVFTYCGKITVFFETEISLVHLQYHGMQLFDLHSRQGEGGDGEDAGLRRHRPRPHAANHPRRPSASPPGARPQQARRPLPASPPPSPSPPWEVRSPRDPRRRTARGAVRLGVARGRPGSRGGATLEELRLARGLGGAGPRCKEPRPARGLGRRGLWICYSSVLSEVTTFLLA